MARVLQMISKDLQSNFSITGIFLGTLAMPSVISFLPSQVHNFLLPKTNKDDDTEILDLSLSWFAPQNIQFSKLSEGIHDATIQTSQGLVSILLGRPTQINAEARARGAVLSAKTEIEYNNTTSAITLTQDAELKCLDVESTEELSQNMFEELSTVHPWFADFLMSTGGTAEEIKNIPIIISKGSTFQVDLTAKETVTTRMKMNGYIGCNKSMHAMDLQYSGEWLSMLYNLIAPMAMTKMSKMPTTNAFKKLNNTNIKTSHSQLHFSIRNDVATFERSDLHLHVKDAANDGTDTSASPSSVTISSWGNYHFVTKKVNAFIGVPFYQFLNPEEKEVIGSNEGIVISTEFILPETPKRGYYLKGGKKTKNMEIDWITAIDWTLLSTQLAAVSIKKGLVPDWLSSNALSFLDQKLTRLPSPPKEVQ